MLAGLTRAEEPDAAHLFTCVIDELAVAPTLPAPRADLTERCEHGERTHRPMGGD